MANGSPYKKAISKKKAIETIKELSGIQFDPELVEIFIEILDGLGEDYLEEIEKYEVFQLVKEENRISLKNQFCFKANAPMYACPSEIPPSFTGTLNLEYTLKLDFFSNSKQRLISRLF